LVLGIILQQASIHVIQIRIVRVLQKKRIEGLRASGRYGTSDYAFDYTMHNSLTRLSVKDAPAASILALFKASFSLSKMLHGKLALADIA